MREQGEHPPAMVCVRCGAGCEQFAKTCWMCGATDLRPLVLPPTRPVSPKKDGEVWYLTDDLAPRKSGMPTIGKVIAALIGFYFASTFFVGLWREAPGAAIAVSLVIGIAILVITSRRSSKRMPPEASTGSLPNTTFKVFAAILTLFATIALVVIVAVAAFIVFAFITCVAMLNGPR